MKAGLVSGIYEMGSSKFSISGANVYSDSYAASQGDFFFLCGIQTE